MEFVNLVGFFFTRQRDRVAGASPSLAAADRELGGGGCVSTADCQGLPRSYVTAPGGTSGGSS